ncbi:MarR family winged helix-turn-helix transcriptional regulator [Desulfovibrio ferrophilus]|uniref:Transcriptional regulator n=1 Tax=Desulfovibrio ferrophilus TaxID=241368 RepID=A0A2Z6AUN5_9BACT|nr:MarR family transcriptional regulator [Desulfovibrio ferrophilus]BBD06896.1 transcriptional regulator [Desulfovibrio ferrophilus]
MGIQSNTPKYEALLALTKRLDNQDESAVATGLDILQTAAAMRMHLHEKFFRDQISEGRFTVLALLLTASDWSLTPSELASSAGVTRATMTGLLDGLEQKEFVERRADKHDRRKITVHLKRIGREHLLQLAPEFFAALQDVGSALPEAKRKSLASLLARIREAAS